MPTAASDHGEFDGPTAADAWVVNPALCLLATMLAGTWLGWTWFAFNAHALASERKGAQMRLLLVGVGVACVMAIGLAALLAVEVMTKRAFDYCIIVLVAWKLWISYKLHVEQRLDSELYAYYGGRVRNGTGILIAGFFFRGTILGALPAGWWSLVLT